MIFEPASAKLGALHHSRREVMGSLPQSLADFFRSAAGVDLDRGMLNDGDLIIIVVKSTEIPFKSSSV